MIGKQFNKFKSTFSSSLSGIQSTKTYDITANTRVNAKDLPLAPQSAFRKRPVKLTYDKNEFHMFRLPSEDGFLLGAMDRDEIFGKRKGVTHSPHIQAQTDMDSNLLWLFAGITLLMVAGEVKNHSEFRTLRENFRDGDMAKLSVSDFK